MKTVCNESLCAGCTACLHACKKDAITIVDSLERYDAIIDETRCVGCGVCYKVCPNNSPIKLKGPISSFEGWAEDSIRRNSSSGGVATAMMKGFLTNGGYVCSCTFVNGAFSFRVVSDVKDLSIFAGSKYVKSDPKDVFKDIDDLLKRGERVLFIGLPCQVAGLKNYVKDQNSLYTVDLICHGSPSPVLLDKYLQESGVQLSDVENVTFRSKHIFGLSIDSKRIVPYRVTDSYTALFLSAVDYTENCYSCKYATIARCSDVTLGDSWGCEKSEMEKGVSLILCQSKKGTELLTLANLILRDADLEKAAQHNHQLKHPSVKHEGREAFFKALKKGRSFRYAAFLAMPKDRIKQNIKYILLRVRAGFR